MVHIIIDLDPDDYTAMKNKQNLYVVIHYTGNKTDSARNNAKYFKNGKRNASAGFKKLKLLEPRNNYLVEIHKV